MSEQALTCIEQNVERYSADDFVATDGDRQLVRSMLYPRPGLYARLSEMHDCGLLDRVFPEFARIHCRVIRDFYHRYTVDEHTLLTIRGIESLWNPDRSAASSASARSSGSARAGAADARAALPRRRQVARRRARPGERAARADACSIGSSCRRDARQTVEFLIRNHLLMSRVAFRRDFDDPHVVEQFADLVGTEERLKMLCLMTLADIGAVSPDTLTPWKEELLWRLYVDAYNRLTLGYADELMQKDPAGLAVVVAGRPEDISEAELTQLPQRAAAPLPDALRPGVDLPARAAGARHPPGRGARRCSRGTTTSGS